MVTRRQRLEQSLGRLRSELPIFASSLRIRLALLFGSTARGDYDGRSDIDLVIVQETTQPFVRRGVDVIEKLNLPIAVDLLVYTPDEWEQLVNKESRFLSRIRAEGKVIYAASA